MPDAITSRLADRARENAPLLRTYAALLAVAVLLGLAIGALPPGPRDAATNVAAFLGILSLSVPTVRLNEQARDLERAKALVGRARAAAEDEPERIARLESLVATLVERKGGWTRPVQAALYAGYALLFASALARLV